MYYNEFGVRPREWKIFMEVLLWLHQQSGQPRMTTTSDYFRNLAQVVLAAKPNMYYSSRASMGPTIRLILERVCIGSTMSRANTPHPLKEDSFDIFQGTASSELDVYAHTQTPQNIMCTANAWAYHCILNGFIHPLNREEITGLSSLYETWPSSILLSEQQVDHLRTSMAMCYQDEESVDYYRLISFEERYSIPEDRRLSQFL